jgi:hypothetical protein
MTAVPTIKVLLLFALTLWQPYYSSLSSNIIGEHLSFIGSGLFPQDASRNNGKLSLKQIEELLKSRIDDETIARLIRERGIDFKPTPAVMSRLQKQNVGVMTRKALTEHEEALAYTAFTQQKQDPAKRLALGREYLRDFPDGIHAREVAAELSQTKLDGFNAAFAAYSRNPEKTRLDQLLTQGRELLNQKPDRTAVIQITTHLALATGRGMIANVYNDLEQSRSYANQALQMLAETSPPPGGDPAAYASLRSKSLSLLYQVQGLYLLRQEPPDPERAIAVLTKAAEFQGGAAATDANTFWLRAIAHDLLYQKSREDYQALSKAQQRTARGYRLCEQINPIINRMVDDITQVLSLSSAAEANPLRTEARAKLSSLLANDRPCLAGRVELIDEFPEQENRYAMVIGVEEYLNQNIQRLNYAATDARLVSQALVSHAGFKKDHVILMADGEANDRRPLRSLILQQFTNLKGKLSPDSLLFIFIAAQSVERGGNAYLLSHDALVANEALLADTAVSLHRIKDLIRETQAGQVVMIVDGFRQEPLTEAFLRALSFDVRKQEVTAFAALTSTGVGQRSYESTARKQSCFSASLIDALRGGAANGDREVTLAELVEYLQTKTPEEALKSGEGAQQKPHAVIEGYKREELAVAVTDGTGGKPRPAEIILTAKTIFIESQTIYMRAKMLEDELAKSPEFKSLGLQFVKSKSEADLVVELTLPFLSWTWTFNVKSQSGNLLFASGKIREPLPSTASPRLAQALIARIQALRSGGQPQ